MTLTDREMQVAAAMERGLTYKEIGAELGVAHSTVRTHVHHVLERLGASDRNAFLRAYRREKVPWVASIMRGRASSATRRGASWSK